MLKFLSRLKRAPRQEIVDARRVYQKVMQQSRNPIFYGPGLAQDSYDGRMEVLCLHLGLINTALRDRGEMAATLGQAIYDVMVSDFDVALREEGLSDTGVSRRIKPLVEMFYERARTYANILDESGVDSTSFIHAIEKHIVSEIDVEKKTSLDIGAYAENFMKNLQACSLGDIAQAVFEFPKV